MRINLVTLFCWGRSCGIKDCINKCQSCGMRNITGENKTLNLCGFFGFLYHLELRFRNKKRSNFFTLSVNTSSLVSGLYT
ncbi:CLUMA_CG015519, isoform A [Clunio marinus]|uniref:CLUMA_CG015519, isoform A n=1 Tax=Clunio marinus TaxID=568069 RepID=A0A1J1IQ91_9DIPT|nr:CLUMA_CG015519, isoform A [Clunio marinus]